MTKKQIINRVTYWQNKLGLSNWRIKVTFQNFKRLADDDKYAAIAKTESNPTYLLADIYFKIEYLDVVDDPAIVHELLHLVLGDIVSYFVSNSKDLQEDPAWTNYFEEKTVATLERIITRINKL